MRSMMEPATIALVVVVLLFSSGVLIYSVSLFPAYVPYQLDEQFNQLDLNTWDIGGAKNFTVTDGALNLFDSTSVRHYFVTNPKWGSFPEPNLQGSIEIMFKTTALTGKSLVVASTDSWRVYVGNRTLVIEITDRPGRSLFRGGVLDSSWHRLLVDREENSLLFQIDDTVLLRLDDWAGNLKWIELGSAQGIVGGLQAQGELSVDYVTVKLQPLFHTGQSVSASSLPFIAIGVSKREM
jgi:hypothetical protein